MRPLISVTISVRWHHLLVVGVLVCGGWVYAASVPHTFTPNTVAQSSQVNENFSYLSDRSWELSGSDVYYDAGSVGIGTDQPGARLEIMGGETGSGSVAMLRLHHADVSNQGDGPEILLKGTFESQEYKLGGVAAVNSGQFFGGDLLLRSKPEDSDQAGALQTQMIVKGNGRVGIGVTTPATTLHVNGPITAAGSGGNVAHDCVWRDTSAYDTNEVISYCQPGEIVMGGGAGCAEPVAFRSGMPQGTEGWRVMYTADCTTVASFALCCQQ